MINMQYALYVLINVVYNSHGISIVENLLLWIISIGL